MTLVRGRLLKRYSSPGAEAPTAATRTHVGRRVPRALLDTAEESRRLLADAQLRATTLLESAATDAERIRTEARAEGHAEGFARTAGLALALRQREARSEDATLDRTLALARLLAERLVGAALTVNDAAMTELARGALAEARGARRIVLRTHPDGVVPLRSATQAFDPDGRVHSIVGDDTLNRGDVVLETEVGTVDARLGTALERLAARLREALRP